MLESTVDRTAKALPGQGRRMSAVKGVATQHDELLRASTRGYWVEGNRMVARRYHPQCHQGWNTRQEPAIRRCDDPRSHER
jgi:hypothetical protein